MVPILVYVRVRYLKAWTHAMIIFWGERVLQKLSAVHEMAVIQGRGKVHPGTPKNAMQKMQKKCKKNASYI